MNNDTDPESGAPGACLPSDMTISAVAGLRQRWLDALQDPGAVSGPWQVDARAVEDIDGAGVQLLLALAGLLHGAGRSLHFIQPSPALRAACAMLGVADLLAHAGDAA